jgi:hypothetical protein
MKNKKHIKKLESLIVENFSKVYNKIKPIDESSVSEHNSLSYYFAKALSTNGVYEEDGYNSNELPSPYNFRGNSVIGRFKYNVSSGEDVSDDDFYDYTIVLELAFDLTDGDTVRYMYITDDSMFHGDENHERNDYIHGKYGFSDPIKYNGSLRIGWVKDSIDITNDLSSEVISKLDNEFMELLEMINDSIKDDDSNMSDSEFHRWANPSMGGKM